ncbi:papilin-like, partial [Limulus polyphemus]|uniref:Papilin-like n=1 Tax=Limulus polyphemus TaxID=6850 RepID=A0ABM1SAX1_LIMPO
MKLCILILCSLICQTIALTLSAPRNLVVTESRTLSHSLELRWDPPLSHDNDIVGYTIFYIIDTPGSRGRWETESTKGNETFAMVPQPHQVTSETRYVFRLQARGINGAGPPSDDFIFDANKILADLKTSEVTTSDNECNLPKESGHCLAYFRNYYYNSEHQQCEEFIYGGCGGNKNNFKSKEECEETCIKDRVQVQPGQTDNAPLSAPRNLVVTESKILSHALDLHWDPPLNHGDGITGYIIYYSVDTPGTPSEWNEIATEGSENFATVPVPHSANDRSKLVFRLQAQGRHSSGPISKDFVYDFNKFFSDDRRSSFKNFPSLCNLPSDTGRCSAYIQRYYYNSDIKQCEEFIYGGCEGNENNFQTKAECEDACGTEEEYDHVLPPRNNVPLSAPKNLVVTESDTVSHTLDLYWDPPISPDEDIIGYTIYYLIDTPGSRGEWKVEKTEGRGTFATIPQPHVVTSESRYVFRLEARGRNSVGPASEDFIFDHKEIVADLTHSGPSTPTNLCNLPSDSGPCHALLRHYYYNSDKNQCEEFIYGGCQGNENNFRTKEECEESCGKKTTEDVSTPATNVPLSAPRNLVVKESHTLSHVLDLHWDPPLNHGEGIIGYTIYYLIDTPGSRGEWNVEKTEGSGTFTTVPQPHEVTPESRYVFRLQAQDKNGIGPISEDFIFEHNEISIDLKTSEVLSPDGVCDLPKVSGPCHEYHLRHYYNPDNKRCEEFIYGGCEGNKNNFKSLAECEEKCGRKHGEDRVPPTRKDNVPTTSKPVTGDIFCNLPNDAGPCFDYLKRYYYSPDYNRCLQFIYGGCEGNDNNFETKAECEDACGGEQVQPRRTSNIYVPLSAPKNLLVTKSREKSHTLELHWNTPAQATEEIVGYVIYYSFGTPETPSSWRVMKVSGNNTFVTISDPHLENYQKSLIIRLQARGKERFGTVSDDFVFEVEDFVTGRKADSHLEANTFCHLPSDSGPCRAASRNYYYNSEDKRCKVFIYGGCEGNKNNFKTKEECEETCGSEIHTSNHN